VSLVLASSLTSAIITCAIPLAVAASGFAYLFATLRRREERK
jgi:hypothetical protein